MDYDICIIGGGPAGYLAGIRAAQLGATAAVIEMDELGGVCTNRGCIPTKSMLEVVTPILSATRWNDMGLEVHTKLNLSQVLARTRDVVGYIRAGIQSLLDARGVHVIRGKAKFVDRFTVRINERETVSARFMLVATGSIPALPPIDGIGLDGVVTSDGMFTLQQVPETVAIIGGGAIGIEYATILKAFGARKVVIIEFMDRLLPLMDPGLSAFEKVMLEDAGIEVVLSSKAAALSASNKGIRMDLQPSPGTAQAGPQKLDVDKVFVVTGRKPNTGDLGLEPLGISLSKGWIDVNMAMRTGVDSIYAAGDVNGIRLLAHAAFHQGMIAVENMLGARKVFEPVLVPSVVYSKPPVAQVGMDETAAQKAGMDVKTGVFDLAGSPMALVHGDPSGFVKIVAEKKYGLVLGASIAGESAYELISVIAAAMAGEITVDELRRTVFAHPSLSESIAESAWAVDGLSQHTIKNSIP